MKTMSNKRKDAELQLRKEICRVGRGMNASGLCAFLGVYAPGNLSARLPGSDRIIISPSGLDKGSLRPKDLVVVDINGQRVEGRYKVSTETPTHCAIYRKRPDVNGVVHAHSPGALAFAVAHQQIPATTIELAAVCGARVPLARYATPGTDALALATVEGLGNCGAVIMANHGIAAVGATLDEAFNNAVSVEFTARININAKTLGGVAELPADEVNSIRNYVLKKYGQK